MPKAACIFSNLAMGFFFMVYGLTHNNMGVVLLAAVIAGVRTTFDKFVLACVFGVIWIAAG